MMINIAIIEDEKKAAELILSYLARYEKETGRKSTTFVFDNALDFISDYVPKYDVIFMDIELPHMNGYDAAVRLRNIDKNVCLVFVTNMVQYAVKGYAVDAMGYMVKPVDYFDFKTQMDKIVLKLDQNRDEEVIVKSEGETRRIRLGDIFYVEVFGHYLIYHTTYGVFRELGQLGKLEETLRENNFFRCNRCYLVNLKHVMGIKEGSITIGGDEIQISRRMKKDFMIALNDYFGGRVR